MIERPDAERRDQRRRRETQNYATKTTTPPCATNERTQPTNNNRKLASNNLLKLQYAQYQYIVISFLRKMGNPEVGKLQNALHI